MLLLSRNEALKWKRFLRLAANANNPYSNRSFIDLPASNSHLTIHLQARRNGWDTGDSKWGILKPPHITTAFNRGCLLRFTHMWYQISPCSWLGFWHLPQFKLRLGNHISDLRSQNWGQHSGFSEENRPKVGFFWKFQKMQFPAFGFKKWDFFWVWGVEKGPTNFFPCQKA